jgi:hypothetical protein
MIELYNPTSVPSRVISVFRALAKISSLSCRSGLLISSGSEGQIEQGDITGQSNISASFCASLLSWCPSSARCGVWLSVLQLDIGWLLVAWIQLYANYQRTLALDRKAKGLFFDFLAPKSDAKRGYDWILD